MPAVGRAKACWLRMVIPLLERNRSERLGTPRPTEMIYRAWSTLHNYLDDHLEICDYLNEQVEEDGDLATEARRALYCFLRESWEVAIGKRGKKSRRIITQLFEEFRLIPPDSNESRVYECSYQMGSPENETGRGRNEFRHSRVLSVP